MLSEFQDPGWIEKSFWDWSRIGLSSHGRPLNSTNLWMVLFQWQVLHEALSNTEMRNTISALTPTGQMAREKYEEMETAYSVGSGVDSLAGIPAQDFTVWPWANFWTSLYLSCFIYKGGDMTLALPFVLMWQGLNDLIHVKCLEQSLAQSKCYHETITRQDEKYSNWDQSKTWGRGWWIFPRSAWIRYSFLGLKDTKAFPSRADGTVTPIKKNNYHLLIACCLQALR